MLSETWQVCNDKKTNCNHPCDPQPEENDLAYICKLIGAN